MTASVGFGGHNGSSYAQAAAAGQYAPWRPRLRLVFAAVAGNELAAAVDRAKR